MLLALRCGDHESSLVQNGGLSAACCSTSRCVLVSCCVLVSRCVLVSHCVLVSRCVYR